MNISSMFAFTSRIQRAYDRISQPVLREFELSKTSFDILMFLANNPDRYTAKDISVIRNIKPNVVSLHVDKLVHDGYLERQSVEEDRRKIRLVCTPKAEPIIEKGRAAQRKLLEKLKKGLQEEDMECFRHCFCVIAKNAEDLEKEKVHLD